MKRYDVTTVVRVYGPLCGPFYSDDVCFRKDCYKCFCVGSVIGCLFGWFRDLHSGCDCLGWDWRKLNLNFTGFFLLAGSENWKTKERRHDDARTYDECIVKQWSKLRFISYFTLRYRRIGDYTYVYERKGKFVETQL